MFDRALEERLNALGLPAATRQQIDAQRPKLAAIETTDPAGRRAIQESFIDGYRSVVWMCVALAVASSISAAFLIDRDRP